MPRQNQLSLGPINVAGMIRTAREKTGLTQERFCAEICACEPRSIRINRRDLSKYESGRNMPPANKFVKILRVSENFLP